MGADNGRVTMTAPISYLGSVSRDEKAYHMMYGDSAIELPRTNITREWRETKFEDIRGRESLLSYSTTGIAIHKLASKMEYGDFDDDHKVWNIYFKELEDLLRDVLDAHEVKFFRYGIRKRHANFPVSTGQEYEFAQPTSIAHVDATLESTKEEMMKQFGDGADALMQRRFQWVNVWRPLRGPVNDWPLCFCDASSIDSRDAEATDMVYPEYFTENLSLRYNRDQRWYYLSDHTVDELIIFKQSDSDTAAIGGVPHCSFENRKALATEPPRESIEARALVIY